LFKKLTFPFFSLFKPAIFLSDTLVKDSERGYEVNLLYQNTIVAQFTLNVVFLKSFSVQKLICFVFVDTISNIFILVLGNLTPAL